MIERFKGKVALVTGASSGYGRGIALQLASEGAAVVCADLRPDPLADGFEPDIAIETDALIRQRGGKASFRRRTFVPQRTSRQRWRGRFQNSAGWI